MARGFLFSFVVLSIVGLLGAALGFVLDDVSPKSFQLGSQEILISGGEFIASGDFEAKFIDTGGVQQGATVNCVRLSSNELSLFPPAAALALGQYLISVEDVNSADGPIFSPILVRKHGGYTITDYQASSGSETSSSVYNVAGGKEILIEGADFFASSEVIVRFSDPLGDFTTDLPGTVEMVEGFPDLLVKVKTPAWEVPLDWKDGCSDPENPVKSPTCVPDLGGVLTVSLDDGGTFSNDINILFGFKKLLKIAYVYPSGVDDFGWAFQLNSGRIAVESLHQGKIDGSTYYEHVTEGSFAVGQENIGSTLETNTPVPEFYGNVHNDYYEAFELFKSFCDDGFDLVFTCSFGFYQQTIDVAKSYAPCQDTTQFVSVGGVTPTAEVPVAFAKIYQMRYLTGIVAGAELKKIAASESNPEQCVGYMAAFPLAETQRGINAFLLGCQSVFASCKVKVMWTGTWGEPDIERNAASFLFEIGKCKVLAQHSDTSEPQKYYAEQGATGIGYNSDVRLFVGDSVLTTPLFSWGSVFNHFIENMLNGEFNRSEYFWPGSAENAVKLPENFSPLVSLTDQNLVLEQKEILDGAFGDESMNHIFCGPLKKRWVYRTVSDDFTGPRKTGCGFQPEWVRLDTPEQVNLKHYRDSLGNPINLSVPEPDSTHCLYGLETPGEALLNDAFPLPFQEDRVFSDYLLDGVELFEPQATLYGEIFGEENPCFLDYGPTGERFYSQPIILPACDGSQVSYHLGECDAETHRTPVIFEWNTIENSDGDLVENICGSEINEIGNIVEVDALPFIEDGPACDYLVESSSRGGTLFGFVALSGVLLLFIIFMLLVSLKSSKLRKHVANMQPIVVIIMAIAALVLNLSVLLLMGKPSDEKCLWRTVLMHICFDIIFSLLWAKIYRVYSVFASVKKMKRIKFDLWDLFKIAIMIILVDVVLLVCWMLISPPKLVDDKFSYEGLVDLRRGVCASEVPAFETVTIFYKGLLIISACALVFMSRNIPSEFVEHKFIIFGAYFVATMAAILFPFQLLSDDPSLVYLLVGITLSLGSCILIGSLSLPSVLVAFHMLTLDSTSKVHMESLGNAELEYYSSDNPRHIVTRQKSAITSNNYPSKYDSEVVST